MRISVIIPVYDRQALAMRALRSALAQTGPLLEVIVVDDASPEPFVAEGDVTGDPRLAILRLDKNAGAAAARNAGAAAARGDWIAFLDSDDTWLPGKLERQARFAVEDQERTRAPLALYATGFRQVNLRSGEGFDRIPLPSNAPADLASGCWYSPGSTALLEKSTFERIGGLDTSLRRLEDLDWGVRLALAGGRLAVAPFVGAVVEVGARPSFAAVDAACRRLEDKWGPGSPLASHPGMSRRLRAYLDVERAAACRYAGNWMGTAHYLARSLVAMPRAGVQLRRWWA